MSRHFWVIGLLALVLCVSGQAVAAAGTYTVGISEEPRTNNIVAAIGTDATTWSFAVLMPQQARLFKVYPPKLVVAPQLAAADPTPFQKEGSYYTSVVQLRKDLTWSDGSKFTSADVVFTYTNILKIGPDKLSGNWEINVNKDVIHKVEAVGDYAVKFWLKKLPGLSEWQYQALQVVILNKKHWEPVFQKAFASQDPVKTLYAYSDDQPVTIGGFVSGRWEKGAFYELKRDPHSVFPYETVSFLANGIEITNSKTGFSYRSPDASGRVEMTVNGGPTVDSVVYRLFLDQNAAYLALQRGVVDYVLNPSGMAKGTQDQLSRNADISIINNAQNGFRYLGFNMARWPMSNKAFRQAVATVINSEWLAENALRGVIEPVSSVVPPGNAFWHNPNTKTWGKGLNEAERLQEAVRILRAAGFTWQKEPQVVSGRNGLVVQAGEGLKGPDGKLVPPVTLLAPPNAYDPLRYTFATFIRNWVRQLGVDIQFKPTDFNVILDKSTAGDYDMLILGWGLDPYPDHLKAFFHSQSSWNEVHYRNSEFDAWVDRFVSATDINEARTLAFKCQEILAEDVPYVVLFVVPMVEAYRNDQVKYEFVSVLDGLQNLFGLPDGVRKIN